ncbi:MAG: DinB family protein [Ferruginibacter sp.]
MKKIILQYANYNIWANQRIIDCITNLSDEQLQQKINSSFKSIYLTLVHLWDVESVWWQRIKLQEVVTWPGLTFNGSVIELGNNLIQQSKQWAAWIDLATETVLEHEFIYKNSKREQFKQPVYEVLHHLFNHQTFHRGQLITMMREVGVEKLPGTDLITFLRKK